MCLLNFHPQRTKLGVSGTCSRHCIHRVFLQLVLCMYSPSCSCGVEAAGNQSDNSWQNNRSYMGPLTPVTGRGSNSGPNHENRPLSLYCWSSRWKCLSSCGPKNTVTSCGYMDSDKYAYLIPVVATNFARSTSLTIVLVPNCLIKGTLILYWNISDITKIFVSCEQIVTALLPYLPAWTGWNVCPSASSYWQWGVDIRSYFWKQVRSICNSQWHVGFSPDSCFQHLVSPIHLLGTPWHCPFWILSTASKPMIM